MRIFLTTAAAVSFFLGAFGVAKAADDNGQAAEKGKARVGTFDSRAVAVAYASSKFFNERLQQMKTQLAEAEAKGDKEKADQIKAQGKSLQEQMHLQGFGTASVKKYLDVVKDKLPAIAKEAHVDFIVSKWDVVYQDPAVEAVDVTEDIVKAFEPNAQTLKSIQDLIKHPPIAEEEIRKIKD